LHDRKNTDKYEHSKKRRVPGSNYNDDGFNREGSENYFKMANIIEGFNVHIENFDKFE
jgi:hypothetical protein